ncbi:MAG TPA: NAD(P)(+) transhydrogenase (Re/Si-specific) subunit beta [Actinomycetota bacterium]|nr:NAD(P)(+) transhydrogenase (Re/Si-specific) subunit beta [Actinomycetota bacterium]
MSDQAVSFAYLAAGILFILALKWLSHPLTARRGLLMGEIGMVLAVGSTLMKAEIVDFQWILIALFIGTAIGIPLGQFVPMTAMPQRIAFSHAFGALAAALVGTAEYALRRPEIDRFTMGALGFEVVLGFLTFTGSLIAFGKLQGIVRDKPVLFRGQNVLNLAVLATAVVLVVVLVVDPGLSVVFPVMIGLALLYGVSFVLRIGGADMPVVISLLNSLAGLSGAAMGLVLNNHVLILAGALDGSSGFLLSLIMSRAMNRSFGNVLFGGFGAETTAEGGAGPPRPVRSSSAEEAAMILSAARTVVIVPGFGMAAAQAQHKVRELADLLVRRGTDVKFAIHPVAGRMPGHMNVLLAEANVPYERLYDLEHINPEFPDTDVALVIGANDVVNPAARHDASSPIYGMPILDVDKANCVMVIKRSMRSGFAGIENELFYLDRTMMLFGDAKAMAGEIVDEVAKLPGAVTAVA